MIALKNLKMENLRFRLNSSYKLDSTYCILKYKWVTFTIWLDLKMVVLVLINQKNILQLRI